MTNLTDVTSEQLQTLKDFASSENKQLVGKLEEILDDVAKTGQYIYPWHFMKPLYACKLDQVTSEFLSSSPPLNNDGTEDEEEISKLKEFRSKLLQMFDKFVCAPFTIQRVSEMLTDPTKHYKSTAKFYRGLEKNILVVSTIDPVSSDLRPVLKRSLREDNPVEKQNGYVDTELKPQLKKIHLEENSAEEAETIPEENNTNDDILNEDKNNETISPPTPTSPPTSPPKPTPTLPTPLPTPTLTLTPTSNGGVEHMLVCEESVGHSNGTIVDNDKTEEVEDEKGEEKINDKNDDIVVEEASKSIEQS